MISTEIELNVFLARQCSRLVNSTSILECVNELNYCVEITTNFLMEKPEYRGKVSIEQYLRDNPYIQFLGIKVANCTYSSSNSFERLKHMVERTSTIRVDDLI